MLKRPKIEVGQIWYRELKEDKIQRIVILAVLTDIHERERVVFQILPYKHIHPNIKQTKHVPRIVTPCYIYCRYNLEGITSVSFKLTKVDKKIPPGVYKCEIESVEQHGDVAVVNFRGEF